MTMSIQELAIQLAKAEEYLRALSAMNVPIDIDEKLKAAARHRLAVSAWETANRDYHEAIACMTSAELSELAR